MMATTRDGEAEEEESRDDMFLVRFLLKAKEGESDTDCMVVPRTAIENLKTMRRFTELRVLVVMKQTRRCSVRRQLSS